MRTKLRLGLAALVAGGWSVALSGGCNPEVGPVVAAIGGDPATDAQGGIDGGADATPPDASALGVAFTDPVDGAKLTSAEVTFRGTTGGLAGGDGVATVFVAIGPNVPVLAQTLDGWRTWSVTAQVPPGKFEARAVAYTVGGLASPPAVIGLERETGLSDAASPVIKVVSPADGSTPTQPLALVQGTASDDLAVVKIDVTRNGAPLTDGVVQTENGFATWVRLVPLLPGTANVLTFTARDASGHTGASSLTLYGPVVTDASAPKVGIVSPMNGAKIGQETVSVTGTASASQGVAEVKLRAGKAPPGNGPVTWGPYAAAKSTDGFGTWSASLPTLEGPFVVEARAIGLNGVVGVAQVTLTGTYVPAWSDEVVVPLSLHDGDPKPQVNLTLDRVGVGQIIGESIQKDTKLLDLDPQQLLVNSLGQIKAACGTSWQADSPDPKHDCSLTPLGQSFQGPDGSWKSSAEYSLVRLLTMTPANVVVSGTSIAGLQNIADGAILGIKIGGGFNQVLAETLGIPRTQEIVPTESVAKALQVQWMASHPALSPSGNIPVSLYDAMNDLAPLGDLLGPAGGHPGVVDPSSPVKSTIFGPDFKMIVNATSNLRWRDGVVLAKGKDYIAVVPAGGDVLSFDFESKAGFDVQGLTPAPTVDLRMKILENPAFVPSCNGDGACKGNLPGKPVGNGFVWSLPSWQLERIVGFSAYAAYQSRTYYDCLIDLLGCKASVAVGQGADPPGWTKFDVLFNLGNPPKDQYLWELIGEVAQVALHSFGSTKVAEGQANVAFTLSGVPVGLTADQLRDAVRPYLQQQGPELSKGLLGDYAKNNGPVDFFYASGADGEPYLMFVAPSDPRPVATYGYKNPGFFSDENLSNKVSTLAAGTSGDAVHEKVKLTPGESTLYAADEKGKVYRLRLSVPKGPSPEISARVAAKVP